jgi:CheY-like chemotaxis protein
MCTADMLLADLGYDVVEASSGEQAATVTRRASDIVITDYLMRNERRRLGYQRCATENQVADHLDTPSRRRRRTCRD